MLSPICTTGIIVRVAAVAAFGALLGLPLAAAGWAADSPSVTFTSGGLPCGSKPDTSRIKVAAGQKVRLANQLGYNATLKIDGSADSTVSNGETVEVQLQRGPVIIGMVPDCPPDLSPSYEQLTIVVTQNGATRSPHPTPSEASKPSSGGGHGWGPGGHTDSSPTGDGLFTEAAVLAIDPSSGVSVGSAATVAHPERSPNGPKLAGDTESPRKGSIVFLAIIATVCVLGVSTGTTYAIIILWTNRPEFAWSTKP